MVEYVSTCIKDCIPFPGSIWHSQAVTLISWRLLVIKDCGNYNDIGLVKASVLQGVLYVKIRPKISQGVT